MLGIFFIIVSCDIKEVTELYQANTAADYFMILWKEEIITVSDVIAMQFLLNAIKCEELERKCVQYAKKYNALHYYEKPPGIILSCSSTFLRNGYYVKLQYRSETT